MIIDAVNHVSFPVRDLARAERFYRDILGLAPLPRPDLPVAGVWLGAGSAQVHLIVVPEGMPVGTPPPALNPAAQHVAFAVADYDAALARLREHEVTVVSTSPELGQMWVQDPDGHVIELIVAAARSR